MPTEWNRVVVWAIRRPPLDQFLTVGQFLANRQLSTEG